MPDTTVALCGLPPTPARVVPAGLSRNRMDAIILLGNKWVNGTTLRYYFFDGESDGSRTVTSDGAEFVTWVGGKEQQDAVRESFAEWKGLGIGLDFIEVFDRSEAEVRIGFARGEGSWSYVGRDVLGIGVGERTMNFGWDLTTPGARRTALHEIGHTLGMMHEHQNPFAGIVWDEEAVYAELGGPPNFWDREKTFNNIIRKLEGVSGSTWDATSIMHYPFRPGLILTPAEFGVSGISPPGTISSLDAAYIREWYPAMDSADYPTLKPFESRPLSLNAGQQADYRIRPDATREYTVRSFGPADTVTVLFEEVDGELRYLAGDDDAGQPRNAELKVRLFKGREYVVRVRLYTSWESNQSAVMYW
ncbi:M12 family metallopeptidase [Spongiactinospora sp. TRM90649]|uniref:M12 family metallopeptidase n=1 Tax=Spongiactinospora sp. TRM90649 TaxID=3031114 RepID=UPI0023F92EAE|nr:M12 family metallopeptidase [Spongiactinospora sp. TRM90649]MDF5757281.1 M12 family metallopeptidase [Spongiactinospora sp. TRM90649]